MKKSIWLIAGITGIFLGNPLTEAQAEVGIRIGDVRVGVGERDRPHFVIDTRPRFIYLPDQGFSVSHGGPYDIIYYGDFYYLYSDGGWYRSSHYRGPWAFVREHSLPYKLRRHGWDDLRRYRDIEFRRHDGRYWEDRDRQERGRYDRGPHREFDRRDERGPGRDDRRDGGDRPDGRGR
ncbi:MAG: hypothetical protein WCL43_07055 [Chlorobium sp.]